MPPKKPQPIGIKVRPNALAGKSVIVTGEIEGQSRASANTILEKAGAKIEKSLNKKVQLVVLGGEPGPQKLEKIESLGIETQEWEDLIQEIRMDGDDNGGDDGVEEEDEEEEEPEKVEEKPRKGKAKAAAKPKAAPKKPVSKPSASGSSSIAGKTVLITGTIPGYDRKGAQGVAEDAGAEVTGTLNNSVDLVILGTRPGPDKMTKIENLGIETMNWSELAAELGLEVTEDKPVANVEPTEPPSSIEGMTVLVTGTIEGHTRSSAAKALESAGATLAKSLNKSVELVVLGTNPGPDKMNKIAELGLDTVTFASLAEKLGLEADSSEPPKKKAKKT